MPMSEWADRVAAGYRGGRPLALLFDYDGTLTPIVSQPSRAVIPSAVRDTLAALARAPGVRVGVISGRPLCTLKEFVGVPGLVYAGSGGMHLDLAGEERVDGAMAEFDRLADPLVEVIAEPVRWFPGAWVERKPGCLAVHYRALSPLKAACFVDVVRDVLAELAPEWPPLRVREVTRALEVALAGSWTKGEAVARVLGELGRDALPVYAGDGANDEEAVAVVNDRGGVTVGVGPEAPPAVRFRAATQDDFATDLARLAAELVAARQDALQELPGNDARLFVKTA